MWKCFTDLAIFHFLLWLGIFHISVSSPEFFPIASPCRQHNLSLRQNGNFRSGNLVLLHIYHYFFHLLHQCWKYISSRWSRFKSDFVSFNSVEYMLSFPGSYRVAFSYFVLRRVALSSREFAFCISSLDIEIDFSHKINFGNFNLLRIKAGKKSLIL